ncbi:hypothetical protein SynBIOSU31_00072 [Synechococcus sp. BIOS-U3-1]|uniref:hypothetical protein n=1 Tax=Synechococcus sp. BIOS-U3-1 TaxID=1400865 RepID=UPI001862322B|nr:hypothetical protein [Synechococcus sp. BIOS-U3-1]QNI56995.1 hypothetical protein SynBIOSU31_00072 [Synechococcus sp. BIOS-U3-1]
MRWNRNSLSLGRRRLDNPGLTPQGRHDRKTDPGENPEDCNWSGTGHRNELDS